MSSFGILHSFPDPRPPVGKTDLVPAAGARDTVARHFTARVPRAEPASTAGEVRAGLAGQEFESASHVAVVDAGRIAGIVSIERLLAAPADVPISAIMRPDPPAVRPDADQETAALRMVHGGETSLAVVGDDGRFLGLVPPGATLAVLLQEHEEDVARLGGYLAGTAEARTASEEPVRRRLWHRLPWLLIGLAGAMAAAAIVGSFEAQLEQTVLLAFFVPAVVYMADAVGTQTEALVIRGIAVGVPIGRILTRELLTGTVIGVLVAAAFLPFAYLVWDDLPVAVTVAIALFASCSVAGLVALALPYLLHRLGRDPAFGSGPLATVIQDLLSIVIFFLVATAIL